MALRVVAGTCRGRRLATPEGDSTRPTSDRVREATFNSLDAHGFVEGANVLDLFAGSGAMGIEALSRGADRATFVDSSRAAATVVESNLRACGFTEQSSVVRMDVSSFLNSDIGNFDLAILDPPYSYDQWADLLSRLDSTVVVIESDRQIIDPQGYSEFGPVTYEVIRQRRYGSTVVTIAVSKRRDDHGGQTEDRQ
ncbi:MAG: 16S rRNA (guanine(966)-N(2))-methyltransferase RsmD [Microthrixaceae bacterium]|nr:16S rRNA (guanine(966)-N(2))-methyltransferase RsmD [Microthrixaceae bacterium]